MAGSGGGCAKKYSTRLGMSKRHSKDRFQPGVDGSRGVSRPTPDWPSALWGDIAQEGVYLFMMHDALQARGLPLLGGRRSLAF